MLFKETKERIIVLLDKNILYFNHANNKTVNYRMQKAGDFYYIFKKELKADAGKALLSRKQLYDFLDNIDIFSMKTESNKTGEIIYYKKLDRA